MLQRGRTGKLPTPRWKKWGWWFTPLSVFTLGACTYWGTQHIQSQLQAKAPQILGSAGIDPTGLKFETRYRDIEVSGILPKGSNATEIREVLASYKGPDGQAFRNASVTAITSDTIQSEKIQILDTQTELRASPQSATSDISVQVTTNDGGIALQGTVPTLSHAETLLSATKLSYREDQIINNLRAAEQPASIADADKYINDLASILSNMRGHIKGAQINLDNEILSGDIYTTSTADQRLVQAIIPGDANSVEVLVRPGQEEIIFTEFVPEVPAEVAEILFAETPTSEPQFDSQDIAGTGNQVDNLQIALVDLQFEIRENVVFNSASDVLKESAYPTLDKVANALNLYPATEVEIAGHTDSDSSTAYNLELSEKRAAAVARYLSSKGVEAIRMRSIGYGESHPITTNDTEDGRAQNRRVEFWAY